MKYIIDKFISLIKEYWNIWGSILVSTLWAWWVGFSTAIMDKTTSYLTMTLMVAGFFTFLKTWYKSSQTKKKVKSLSLDTDEKNQILIGEKIINSQKQIKSINLAINPTQKGEEMGLLIVKIMKGGKIFMKKFFHNLGAFFRWVWGNKFTLTDTILVLFIVACSNIATFTDYLYKFEFCANHKLTIQICVPVISAIYCIVDLYTTYTKYGCESNAQLTIRYEEKKQKALEQLTPEQKKAIKDRIAELTPKYKEFKTNYELAQSVIKKFQVLQGIKDYEISSDELTKYNNAIQNVEGFKTQMEMFEQKIKALKEQL